MFKKYISFSNVTLLVALSLSTVAAYYSIIGLTAIFAGAVIPIIVMGSILEIGKITTTVWLRKYWHRASITLKLYLVPAVVLLAFLTSMGIFGFLSKAHSDQSLVSGDVLSKLEIYEQKISTAKENIQSLRNELKQMDAAVDQVMARSTTEQGADKSNTIRKSQQRDRNRINKEIEANQKLIASLNDQAAPIRAEVRKVEAEVGPIKYIAAFIYGDNPDTNLLEAAVRWVIILIVIVFDPLAIALVLAANASKEWDKEESDSDKPDPWIADVGEKPTAEEIKSYEQDDGPLTTEQLTQLKDSVIEPDNSSPSKDPAPIGWMFGSLIPTKKKNKKTKKSKPTKQPVQEQVEEIKSDPEPILAESSSPERPGDYIETNIETKVPVIINTGDGYVTYNGKQMKESVARSIDPKLFQNYDKQIGDGFGTTFPLIAESGNIFVKTDSIPNKVFKFNGRKWIEIQKDTTSSYLTEKYVEFLINKISSGEYDIELLTDVEQDTIQNYMKK
jgi:ElaB/YqjD/DUF883 family membrane-anchored ribosome-binding protein